MKLTWYSFSVVVKRVLIWYPFVVVAPVATSASGWKDAFLNEAGQSGRSYRHVKPVQLWCYISLLEEGYYLVQKGLRFEGGTEANETPSDHAVGRQNNKTGHEMETLSL